MDGETEAGEWLDWMEPLALSSSSGLKLLEHRLLGEDDSCYPGEMPISTVGVLPGGRWPRLFRGA